MTDQTELKVVEKLYVVLRRQSGQYDAMIRKEDRMEEALTILSRYGDLKKKEGAVEALSAVLNTKIKAGLYTESELYHMVLKAVRKEKEEAEQEIKQIKKEMEG